MTMNRFGGGGRPSPESGHQSGFGWLRSLSLLRPSSPAQLALVGLVLVAVGLLVPAIVVLAPAGIVVALIAGISTLLRPRHHEQYWRGRRLEVGEPPSATERLYRLIYRR